MHRDRYDRCLCMSGSICLRRRANKIKYHRNNDETSVLSKQHIIPSANKKYVIPREQRQPRKFWQRPRKEAKRKQKSIDISLCKPNPPTSTASIPPTSSGVRGSFLQYRYAVGARYRCRVSAARKNTTRAWLRRNQRF